MLQQWEWIYTTIQIDYYGYLAPDERYGSSIGMIIAAIMFGNGPVSRTWNPWISLCHYIWILLAKIRDQGRRRKCLISIANLLVIGYWHQFQGPHAGNLIDITINTLGMWNIHGWKATDLSFVLAPSDQNLNNPTSRQNFGDAPGQTPKLILTLWHKHFGKLYLVLMTKLLWSEELVKVGLTE